MEITRNFLSAVSLIKNSSVTCLDMMTLIVAEFPLSSQVMFRTPSTSIDAPVTVVNLGLTMLLKFSPFLAAVE